MPVHRECSSSESRSNEESETMLGDSSTASSWLSTPPSRSISLLDASFRRRVLLLVLLVGTSPVLVFRMFLSLTWEAPGGVWGAGVAAAAAAARSSRLWRQIWEGDRDGAGLWQNPSKPRLQPGHIPLRSWAGIFHLQLGLRELSIRPPAVGFCSSGDGEGYSTPTDTGRVQVCRPAGRDDASSDECPRPRALRPCRILCHLAPWFLPPSSTDDE